MASTRCGSGGLEAPEGKRGYLRRVLARRQSHLWSAHFMEKMGPADKVTLVGVVNVDTMLGSLKSRRSNVPVECDLGGERGREERRGR